MERDDVINFRVPAELKVALRRAADQDERSMSVMATRILREWLVAKGFLEPSPTSASPGVAPGRRSRARGAR